MISVSQLESAESATVVIPGVSHKLDLFTKHFIARGYQFRSKAFTSVLPLEKPFLPSRLLVLCLIFLMIEPGNRLFLHMSTLEA